ncbi:MAG: UpxY family transcription antiterminator [Bacteroidales bacterium]|nr:UpxY family transcription antiterminator [Bacteroidales bacterium]
MDDNSVFWYPMRVTYQQEMKAKRCLDSIAVENFLPMTYAITDTPSGTRRVLVPAIHNLLFVRASQQDLTKLKNQYADLLPLRYMVRPATETRPSEIITVPDKEMDDFVRVASIKDDGVLFLDCGEYLQRPGTPVRIVEGPLAGVEGVIKRIRKNRQVVVQVANLLAVATYVPASALLVLDKANPAEA